MKILVSWSHLNNLASCEWEDMILKSRGKLQILGAWSLNLSQSLSLPYPPPLPIPQQTFWIYLFLSVSKDRVWHSWHPQTFVQWVNVFWHLLQFHFTVTFTGHWRKIGRKITSVGALLKIYLFQFGQFHSKKSISPVNFILHWLYSLLILKSRKNMHGVTWRNPLVWGGILITGRR